MKKLISLLIVFTLILSFGGCGKKEASAPETSATNVTIEKAKNADIESTLEYTGEVKASSQASVSAGVSGSIKEIHAEIGDYVTKGTVLMTIDSSAYKLSYNQAKAAYNSAMAAYNNVKNGSNAQSQVAMNQNLANAQSAYDSALDNYNRQKSLFDIGAVSQVALDAAKTQLDNAKIALDTVKASADLNKNVIAPQSEASAKAAVEQTQAAMALAADSVAKCSVTAPISGYVASKNASIGQMASPGIEAFSIKDSDSVDIEINVTESVIGKINVGTDAKIDIKSAGLEDVKGTVSVAGEAKNDATGMFTVKISIPNEDKKIKVGMLANISITTEKVEDTLIIPADAVFQDNDEYFVYIAEGETAKKKTVETGVTDGKSIEILSGIKAGDKVIVDGKDFISEKNNKIRIVNK